jgi:mRNA deadenylase 3'-5' endonuclease subunit Ccr4
MSNEEEAGTASIGSTSGDHSHMRIKIVSYNILSDCYVRVPGQFWNAFEYCRDEFLDWNNRLPKILSTLMNSNAHVICLQEVTLDFIDNEWTLPVWTNNLISNGYTAILQGLTQKEWTKNAERNLKMVGRKNPTGLVTLYKHELFEEYAPSKHGAGSGISIFIRQKGTLSTSVSLAINNIHLVGDPSKFEMQVKQLDGVLKHFNLSTSSSAIVEFICGDFNGSVNLIDDSPLSRWFTQKFFLRTPTGISWSGANSNNLALDHIMYRILPVTADVTIQVSNYFPQDNVEAIEALSDGLPSLKEGSDHLMIGSDYYFLMH